MAAAARVMAHRRPERPAAGEAVLDTRDDQRRAAPHTVAAIAAGDGVQARLVSALATLLRDAWAWARLHPRLAVMGLAALVVAALPLASGTPATSGGGIDAAGLTGRLVAVAGLLFLTLMGLRRVQAGSLGADRRLTVLETRPLGPKASLHLVAVGDRRLVVGLTPGGMVSLAELHASELDAAPDRSYADGARPAFEAAEAAEAEAAAEAAEAEPAFGPAFDLPGVRPPAPRGARA